MSNKKLEQLEESDVRALARALSHQGVKVRREKLARGREYRVKSGRCNAFGASILFVDRALPAAQQSSVIIDFCLEHKIPLYRGDLKNLSPAKTKIVDPLITDIAPAVIVTIEADEPDEITSSPEV
jgi:hypothetical protein